MTAPLPLGLAEQIEALEKSARHRGADWSPTVTIRKAVALCAEAWGRREAEQAARIAELEINLCRSDAALLDFYQQLADAKAKVELKRSAPALIAASRRAALQEKK